MHINNVVKVINCLEIIQAKEKIEILNSLKQYHHIHLEEVLQRGVLDKD